MFDLSRWHQCGQKHGITHRLASMMLCASLLVAASAWADGIGQLKAFVAQVHSARGNFVQREVNAPSAGERESDAIASARRKPILRGTFVFARPGKFIWSYDKPYQQRLQSDGKTLYEYDHDLNQVVRRSLGGALGTSPAAILFGSNDLEKNFALRDVGVKGGLDWVELRPKTKDTQFQSVGIGFRNGNLQAMELHDVFGNVTLLTFSNIKKNPPLNASRFRFVMPKGAEVISG